MTASPYEQLAQSPFDERNPTFLCCGRPVKPYALWIAVAEIVISAIIFIVTMSVVGTKAPGALGSVSITLTIYVLLKIAASICVIVGQKQEKHQLLMAYIIFKGIEIGLGVVGMLVSFLILLGFTALFGVVSGSVSSASGGERPTFPPDDPEFEVDEFSVYGDESKESSVSPEPGDYHHHGSGSHEVQDVTAVQVTGIFIAVFLCLLTLVAVSVFFLMVVVKCYQRIKALIFHRYARRKGKEIGAEMTHHKPGDGPVPEKADV